MASVHRLHKFLERLHQAENFTLFMLFIALLGLAFSQVVLRNFFGTSIVWADVGVRTLVLWVAIFGAMIATRKAEHIQIDLLQSINTSKKIQHIAKGVCNLGAAIIASTVAFYSFEMVRIEYAYPTYAFAKVPTWLAQSVLPCGFSVMGIRFFIQTFLSFKQAQKGG